MPPVSGVMHVAISNPRWRGKRCRNSRRMRNPQFYASGKGPIGYKTALPLLEQALITFDVIHNVHAGDVKAPGIFKHSKSRLDMIARL